MPFNYKLYALIILIIFSASSTSLLISGDHDNQISSTSESSLILNEYEGDGESYWKSKSYFAPIIDTAYGTIKLQNSFYMKFSLIWHGLLKNNSRGYEGIFRIGKHSTNTLDCDGHATRYPALYLDGTDP
eukprot:317927_1